MLNHVNTGGLVAPIAAPAIPRALREAGWGWGTAPSVSPSVCPSVLPDQTAFLIRSLSRKGLSECLRMLGREC